MSIVRFHMMAKRVSFRDLAQMLNDAGIEENERNLRAKVARGEMQANYFLICMRLLGCEDILLRGTPVVLDDVSLDRRAKAQAG